MFSPVRLVLIAWVGSALLLEAAHLSAATYYVAVPGSDTNDGTSPEQAWRTVTHAAKKAAAGDTVYIKAGLYREPGVDVKNSGTEKAPIIFQGYKDKPGDTPDPQYKPGDKLNPDLLPVLEGELGKGSGISFSGKNCIEFRHLGVTGYSYGLYPQNARQVKLENLFVITTGSMGMFFLNCANCTVRNCVVTDGADNNIYLRQTHSSVIENCKTYGVTFDKAGATDYYIVLQSDCHDNVVRDCLSHNTHADHTDIHPGHGIGIKDGAQPTGYPNPHSERNKFINCVARNNGEYFFAAHGACNNEFINCTAIGEFRKQAYWSEGINIRDGAHDNTFRDCRIEGTRTGVALQDTVEGPKNPDGSPLIQACTRNTIVNCVFVDTGTGIEVYGPADDNMLRNCVFDGVESLLVRFVLDRKYAGNTCRNTIVTNARGAFQRMDKGTGGEFVFTYSDFWEDKFKMPAGTGNMAVDPLFADAEKRDYHLKSQAGRWDKASSKWVKDAQTSPCVDAGDPADDFSGEPKPNGGRIDIGAYGGTGAEEAPKSAEGDAKPTSARSAARLLPW